MSFSQLAPPPAPIDASIPIGQPPRIVSLSFRDCLLSRSSRVLKQPSVLKSSGFQLGDEWQFVGDGGGVITTYDADGDSSSIDKESAEFSDGEAIGGASAGHRCRSHSRSP
ncbi:hypothetical protein JCGZ_15102 [Jatropha curcas]|uniref:Uncharacterized protein n=1 Tax=Jatropha curcas TaxID=180498 RepID=A0A067LA39_JATCU|nr:hypothetical protein JCGZ_15102 [Jatropha curcas]